MLKFLKNIGKALTKINDISETIEEMKLRIGVVESTDQFIPITSNELGQIWKNYSHMMYIKEKESLRRYRGNLADCLYQYDRLLYTSTQVISSSNPIVMLNIMQQLTIFKEFIYEIMFDNQDVESFYLYFLDTQSLRAFASDIPLLDLDKVFLIGYSHETLSDERYVKVSMTQSQFIISTPKEEYTINLKLRKSVLRALYSLYTKKYHLYHLNEEDIVPMKDL